MENVIPSQGCKGPGLVVGREVGSWYGRSRMDSASKLKQWLSERGRVSENEFPLFYFDQFRMARQKPAGTTRVKDRDGYGSRMRRANRQASTSATGMEIRQVAIFFFKKKKIRGCRDWGINVWLKQQRDEGRENTGIRSRGKKKAGEIDPKYPQSSSYPRFGSNDGSRAEMAVKTEQDEKDERSHSAITCLCTLGHTTWLPVNKT